MANQNIDTFHEILKRLEAEIKELNTINFEAHAIIIKIQQKFLSGLEDEIEKLGALLFEAQGVIMTIKFLSRKLKRKIENLDSPYLC